VDRIKREYYKNTKRETRKLILKTKSLLSFLLFSSSLVNLQTTQRKTKRQKYKWQLKIRVTTVDNHQGAKLIITSRRG
jgi:hypothetical protein